MYSLGLFSVTIQGACPSYLTPGPFHAHGLSNRKRSIGLGLFLDIGRQVKTFSTLIKQDPF